MIWSINFMFWSTRIHSISQDYLSPDSMSDVTTCLASYSVSLFCLSVSASKITSLVYGPTQYLLTFMFFHRFSRFFFNFHEFLPIKISINLISVWIYTLCSRKRGILFGSYCWWVRGWTWKFMRMIMFMSIHIIYRPYTNLLVCSMDIMLICILFRICV